MKLLLIAVISTFIFVGLSVSAAGPGALPAAWQAIEIPGTLHAWENSDDRKQIITVVESHTDGKMSFKGESRESIASGLMAFRQAALAEFNITDWTVREFNYEELGTCERVTFTGSYTRPEGVKVQFIEHNVFRGQQMIQTSMLIEQDNAPSHQDVVEALLTKLDTCE